jgi:Protein of unknown function (DUF732)
MTKTILAVAAALMLSSGIAHADPSDDADYLRALHKQGITATGGDQTMIKLGHMICDLRSDGYSENSAISMAKLHGKSMTDQDAKVIVTSAEAAYCPEYIQ